MKDSYIVYKGNRIDFTEEQIKMLGLDEEKEIKNNIFDRVNYNDYYYFITSYGYIKKTKDNYVDMDDGNYEVANYCVNREIMKKRAMDEVLNRLLWRFSMENGWDDELWKDETKSKWYISFCYDENRYDIVCNRVCRDISKSYFASQEIAQRAIDEIVIPFEKGELPICKIFK